MEIYEKPQLLLEDSDEEVCVDVHSSGLGVAIIASIILTVVWPPLIVE